MATMAASESSFSSETEGSSSKGASGKSQVSGKNILYLDFITKSYGCWNVCIYDLKVVK